MLGAGTVGTLVGLLAAGWGPAPGAARPGPAACDPAALRKGENIDLGALKKFVARGCDIDTLDREGRTLLHSSVGHEDWKTALWLIEHGADFKRVDENGDSILEMVLYHAADSAHGLTIFEALVRRGADVNGPTRSGLTLLQLADANDNPKLLRALLAHGANPNVTDGFGTTPLFHAARRSDWASVRALLKAGARPTGRDGNQETIWYVIRDPTPAIVSELLRHGADVHERNASGDGPLHVLAYKSVGGGGPVLAGAGGDASDRKGYAQLVAVAKLLIAHGADPRATNDRGETPLHLAARDGFVEMAKLLIASRAPVEATDKDGQTPLHEAAWIGHADMAALLLGHGAVAGHKDATGLTPLHWLARGRHGFEPEADGARTIKLLLGHGAKIDEADREGRTAFWHAMGDLRRMTLLGAQRPNRQTQGPRGASLLHLAIYRDENEDVLWQIAPGAQVGGPDRDGRTPLQWAAFFGRPRAAIRLINAISLNARSDRLDATTRLDIADRGGRTALDWAITACQRPVAAVLLRQGARATTSDWRRRLDACPARPEPPPIDERLHVAAVSNDTKLMKTLLDGGLPVDGRDATGRTPLHIAAAVMFSTDAAQVLLARGAKVGAVDREGRRPLHIAAEALNVNVVRVLLKAGADANAADDRGSTPLHLARLRNSSAWDLYDLLIGGGAKVGARDRMGRTPLHTVCDTDDAGAAAAAAYFICHGADPDARDSFGWTAADIARLRNWPDPNMPRCPAPKAAPAHSAR
jgi:cytohesin